MRWVKLVLALVLVVGWTSAALAECAWVLWDRLSVNPSGEVGSLRWLIHDAYTTRGECNSVKLEGWEARVNQLKGTGGTIILNQPGSIIIVRAANGEVTQRLWCLPDTIDPRGRKE